MKKQKGLVYGYKSVFQDMIMVLLYGIVLTAVVFAVIALISITITVPTGPSGF